MKRAFLTVSAVLAFAASVLFMGGRASGQSASPSGGGTFTGGTVTSTVASTVAAGNAFKSVGGSKYCLNTACTSYVYDDGFNTVSVQGANNVFVRGSTSTSNSSNTHFAIGTDFQNNALISGASSPNPPTIASQGTDSNIDIKLIPKGTGGVLVPGIVLSDTTRGGQTSFSASTTKTVTVVSGCRPICTDNTSAARTVSCAVSTTTLTATGSASSSDTFTYLCI